MLSHEDPMSAELRANQTVRITNRSHCLTTINASIPSRQLLGTALPAALHRSCAMVGVCYLIGYRSSIRSAQGAQLIYTGAVLPWAVQ